MLVACLQQEQPPKDGQSAEHFDLHAVTKLHQESMAGCVRLLIITEGIFMHLVDSSEHSILSV
jgi:hypothetical protein